MQRSIGNIIADSVDRCLGYAEGLLTGVTKDNFARFASPGGVLVESNHPAFIYGHLSLYGPQILTDLGVEAPAISDLFQTVFTHQTTCKDDPEGTIYPDMKAVTDLFFDGYRSASAALRQADDEVFAVDNPRGGKALEIFPTMGSMHAFYGSGHLMIHLGQMSAWRRMQGLGSLS